MIKAIIFDLDGTLYPKTNPLYQSMSTLIREWFKDQLKVENSSFDEYFRKMKLTYPNPLEAINKLGLELSSFHDNVFGKLDPMPHLSLDENLLSMLKDISSKKFVVTLSSYQHANNVLKTLGIKPFFLDIIVPGNKWNTISKIDAYEVIRTKYGLMSTEMCVVGDDVYNDLLEANVAGYKCVLISDNQQDCKIQCIKSIHSLKKIIQK